jgi:hypothetical protein
MTDSEIEFSPALREARESGDHQQARAADFCGGGYIHGAGCGGDCQIESLSTTDHSEKRRNGMNDISEPTATSAVAAAAQTKVLVTDARGRVIAVRKVTLINFYNLNKAMKDDATNPTLMDMAVTAAAVSRIDTTDFAFPATEADVRFLMQQLDFDGLKAAGEGLRQLHAKADDGTEAAKNSAGSQDSN